MSGKTILISSGILLLILIGLAFLFTSASKSNAKVVSYDANSAEKPKAEVAQSFADLGEIKVSDVKKTDFTIKNSGTKPLQIIGLTTSCHCTFGQIIYKDLTTQEYGMSVPAGYITDVAPGETAIVRVIYKPYIMPVFGFVEREVYITTNDPLNQKLIFSIKMNVR
ncbi:DUF1573 domain-containing protein [Candidatus Woesebacteria bacterium]|nr:DUF1573 domain-containing protein [Candidatus Woesebacteria bacterium]QQG47890.1 MAG: DUF1573 domain-containing protein [Candidatus Woesebacteria bacterium]